MLPNGGHVRLYHFEAEIGFPGYLKYFFAFALTGSLGHYVNRHTPLPAAPNVRTDMGKPGMLRKS